MPNRTSRTRDLAVERLTWTLLAALSGVGAGMTACGGQSQRTENDGEAGDPSGAGGRAGSPGTGGHATGGKGSDAGGAAGSVTIAGAGFGGSSAGDGVTAGTGAAGSGGTGVVTGGAGGEPPTGCAAAGPYGNLVSCESGFAHRPEVESCELPKRIRPSAEGGAAGEFGGAGSPEGPAPPVPHQCDSDIDCVDQPNGICLQVTYQPSPELVRVCQYPCSTDADCGSEAICTCEGQHYRAFTGEEVVVGVCHGATCKSDADCNGSLCISPIDAFCGTPRPSEFHCQSPEDECSGPGDCPAASYCSYSFTEFHYVCQGRPACGRPFLVDGEERVAPSIFGDEWSKLGDTVDCAGLDAELRVQVARHYVAAGLMEHASIAAFARFALQLLALGAPPALVEDTTRAIADETRHAKLCFGLAARYEGHATGPGPLALDGALAGVSLLEVADLVVREGCIGETGAALEAAWAADGAQDPALRALLSSIAEDELRHAALAFRFVAWAAGRDARVQALFTQRVAEARRAAASALQALPVTPSARAELLSAHGVLDERTRAEARRRALDDIVGRAALALPEPGHFTSSIGAESQPNSSST